MDRFISVNKGISLSSSEDDDDYIMRPLSKRIAVNIGCSPPDRKISKSVSKQRSRAETHSLSESDDSDFDLKGVNSLAVGATLERCSIPISNSDTENTEYLPKSISLGVQLHSQSDSKESSYKEDDDESSQNSQVEDVLPITSNITAKGQRKPTTRSRNPVGNAKNEERQKAREEKLQQKLFAKTLRELDRESKRCAKPQEVLKSVVANIDSSLTNVDGSEAIFNALLDGEISYNVEKNDMAYSVTWHRRVATVTMEDNQVRKLERDQQENTLLLYIPSAEFVEKVQSSLLKRKGKNEETQTLLEYVSTVRKMFPSMKVTCVTIGLEGFLRSKSGSGQGESEGQKKMKCPSKKDCDDVLVELQLQSAINYYSLSNMTEFGNLLARFTKAIAEAPFKLEKQEQQKAFSWYAQADSSCPVKIEKDGKGAINLWQQQIQQFHQIGKEISQAIAAEYASPLALIEAYKQCPSEKEAEKLLQDIVVRRTYGPLGTTRRVGPELSYKMYRFFTSRSENELLQR